MKRLAEFGLVALLAVLCFAGHPVNAAQTLTRSTGELVCAYTSIAVGEGGNAVVTCVGQPPVVVPPPPPPPVGENEFTRGWAMGLSLNDVHDYLLHGGLPRRLTDAQWAQALAAGYHRSDLDAGSGGGGQPLPTDDLTGRENGPFIPSHQFPSAAIRWTARANAQARFVLVEETHPSAAQSLTATVTDNLGNAVITVFSSQPIRATVDVPFAAIAGRTYYLIVTPDAPLWRHVEMRTR